MMANLSATKWMWTCPSTGHDKVMHATRVAVTFQRGELRPATRVHTPMRILSWLFGGKKAQASSAPAATPVVRSAVERNIPLEYVHSRTGRDTEPYRKIADMVQAHSYAAAEEFARLVERKSTDQLVHFFHDMFTAVCLVPQVAKLAQDKDVGSAIVDGVHFQFYKDASQAPVESILHLWGEGPKCFFQTFTQSLGRTDNTMRLVQFAAYCVDPELQLGATDALKLSEAFMRIVNEKATSVSTSTDIMLGI